MLSVHNRATEAAKKGMRGGSKSKEGGVVREGYNSPSPYLSQKSTFKKTHSQKPLPKTTSKKTCIK